MSKSTDVTSFLSDLHGGVFERQLGHLLSDVASGVTTTGKDGEIVVKFKVKQLGGDGSTQVNIKAELSHKTPTARGHKAELIASETPMHVGTGGAITLFPDHTKQLIDERS